MVQYEILLDEDGSGHVKFYPFLAQDSIEIQDVRSTNICFVAIRHSGRA
jgi:hypothetical protein